MAAKQPPKSAINLVDFLQDAVTKAIKDARDPREVTDVGWEGTKITLPADPEKMPYRKAIEVLLEKEAAATQEYELFERIPGMPLDAAHAFTRVLEQRYGWINAQTKKTFFGPQPPRMQIVKTGHKPEDYVEVPIGQFKLNDISTNIETGFTRPSDERKAQFMDFYVSGTVNFEDRKVVMDLISATKRYMAEHSIYQGKPMRLTVDSSGDLNALIQPEFIDLDSVDSNGLVLNSDVQGLVDVALMTPIRKTELCLKHKIPLKRGILLYGPYGTGKTLTALVTAKEAQNHGWTFVMLDNVKSLAGALEFARQFQPCVVFGEDIDRAVDKNGSDRANDIINTIDSALIKSDKVITVLTTNHIDRIPPIMLRNGRLDALIPINLPDQEAAIKLVRYYAGPLLASNDPLSGLGEKLVGFIPATIREVVERSKLSMLMNDRKQLTVDDLSTSAFALQEHAKLLVDEPAKPSKAEQAGLALKALLNGSGDGVDLGDLEEKVDEVDSSVGGLSGHISNVDDKVSRIAKMIERLAPDAEVKEILQKVRKIDEAVAGNGARR